MQLTKDSTPKEVQDEWVRRLESGEYTQTQKVLCKISGGKKAFCCLGLLSEMGVEAGVIASAEMKRGDDTIVQYGTDRVYLQTVVAPLAIRVWAGLNTPHGTYYNSLKSLASDNDMGKPFSEIAEIIKSRPSGLFTESK